MKKFKRMLTLTLLVVAGYLVISSVLHYIVFPLQTPDYANALKPGDRLYSKAEGFEQTIISKRGNMLQGHLEVKPYAPGPPEHLHENFEETFVVKEGTLSIMVNGEKKVLHAGESITIPVNTPHKPFNETGSIVVVEGNEIESSGLPEKFGYYLSKLYVSIDNQGDHPSLFKTLLQLSVYGNEMDTWVAEGPPVKVQKFLRFIMAPTARLLGYKN